MTEEYNLEKFKRFVENLGIGSNLQWYNYFKRFAEAWEKDIEEKNKSGNNE